MIWKLLLAAIFFVNKGVKIVMVNVPECQLANCCTGIICQQYDLFPLNITRCIGERDIFIPCLHPRGPHLIWLIDNQTQDVISGSATSDFIPIVDRGLLIPLITRDMNQTTFSCILQLNPSDRPIRSRTGILTVIECCCK